MKATLKPEEERVVTPGPQAVDDLLDLPPEIPGSVVEYLVVVRNEVEEMERRTRVRFGADDLEASDGKAGHWKFVHAIERAHDLGGYIASSALTFNLLERLYDQPESPSRVAMLKALMQPTYTGIWQNTLLDFETKIVSHYPQGMYGGGMDLQIANSGNPQCDGFFHQISGWYDWESIRSSTPVTKFIQFVLGMKDLDKAETMLKHCGYELELLLPEDWEHPKLAAVFYHTMGNTFSVSVAEIQTSIKYARMVMPR